MQENAMSVENTLVALRKRVADRNHPKLRPEFVERISITPSADTFDLQFYGDCFEENYSDLIDVLAEPNVASRIRSLVLDGPDEGANGTQNWDIEALLADNTFFPRMELFSVRQRRLGDHNRPVVASVYDEDGVLAKLIEKAPMIQSITVPSAPNANFFSVGDRPIRFMSIDAGYDTQEFILNLASSTAFKRLQCLEWGEYSETYIDDYQDSCTPFDHYMQLFRSDAFDSVSRFVWRNPICTENEIAELKILRPNLQFLIVRNSDHYA